MSNSKLQVFLFDTQPVRIVGTPDAPWWVAKDVAEILEYRDAANATRNLDDDEKGTQIVSTLGGDQQMLCVNESGLYSLILTSRKPEAKRFKKWVTSEVLPTIRKTGSYSVHSDDPKLLIEREKTERERIKAQAKLDELRLRHELKLAELEHKQQAKRKTDEQTDLDLSQPNKSVIKLSSRNRIHLSSEQKEQLKAWLQGCCEVDKSNKINVGKDLKHEDTAYSSYLKWCDRHQVKPLYLTKFSASVVLAAREIGWEVARGRTREGRVLDGIRLKA